MMSHGRDERSPQAGLDGNSTVRRILEECELVRLEVQARVRAMDAKIAHVEKLGGRRSD